jgi:hypothetical protein
VRSVACECELFYRRKRGLDVDFVMRAGRSVMAIEVKSGRAPIALPDLSAFSQALEHKRNLLVGGEGIPVEDFLSRPFKDWLRA